MNTKIKESFALFKAKYKENPAWHWLCWTIFLFFLLPEYISPFILFVAFIIFKRQWTKEGRLAKVGTLGKIEMVFMIYMLVSTIWSPTKLDTLGCASLWWAVFLIQIMIYNLARTKEKIEKLLSLVVCSAAINGIIGAVQVFTYTLWSLGYIRWDQIFVTPLYRYVDIAVYDWLPFKIQTLMWWQRASGCFSNPNLLATFMLVAYPLAIYLFLNAKKKSAKIFYFFEIACISAGMASTLTRAGCLIMLAGWIVLFVIFIKRHAGKMLAVLCPTAVAVIPALLTRYGIITIQSVNVVPKSQGYSLASGYLEAEKSSEAHFDIWKSMIDYITHHANAFLIGTGFGMENTGYILYNLYNLNKPHSHNFIIEIWAELGIVGIIMLSAIIICAVGKLLEINANSKEKLTMVFCVLASFAMYFIFGLSDYIFNSPKQIIVLMLLAGIIQAMSYTFEKTPITKPKDLQSAFANEFKNVIR